MMGIRVNFIKSSSGTGTPSSVSIPLGRAGGTSPSGKGKLLPGSYDTIARTFSLLIAVNQPPPPPWEWVTIIPGPTLSNNAATASDTTWTSNGPVLGVICRKYWFKDSASRGNCTPSKKSGQFPTRKLPNQSWSSVAAETVVSCVLRPASPRRGWSTK